MSDTPKPNPAHQGSPDARKVTRLPQQGSFPAGTLISIPTRSVEIKGVKVDRRVLTVAPDPPTPEGEPAQE